MIEHINDWLALPAPVWMVKAILLSAGVLILLVLLAAFRAVVLGIREGEK